VTYGGTCARIAQHPNWAPFCLEVIALRIDGSGEMRRIVQTRHAKRDYWSEPHASPSPDGSRVIWSSNWGNPGGKVADYVARVRWPEPAGITPPDTAPASRGRQAAPTAGRATPASPSP
jgi:hypothetical protein